MTVEGDFLALWVSDKTQVVEEIAFMRDNNLLEDLRTDILIATAKPGNTLLSKAAWNEFVELQTWIRTIEYVEGDATYALDNFCFKSVSEQPSYSCFATSPLDCFQEGRSFVPGGENNTVCWSPYDVRQSFNSKEWDFATNFTADYLSNCVQWYSEEIPHDVIMADVIPGETGSHPIKEIGALRLTISTLAGKSLAEEGVNYVSWQPTVESVVELDALGCPVGGPYGEGADFCKCSLDFNVFSVAEVCPQGTIEGSPDCCNLLAKMNVAPCFRTLLDQNPEVAHYASLLFQRLCHLELPPPLQPRCSTPSVTSSGEFTSFDKCSDPAGACTDDATYTVSLGGNEYDCAGAVMTLHNLGVPKCNQAAERAPASSFTEDMQEDMLASCPLSCKLCSAPPLPLLPSPPPVSADSNSTICEDKDSFSLGLFGIDHDCSSLLATLAIYGVTNCTWVAEIAKTRGTPEIFTDDMEKDLLANCPFSCKLCSAPPLPSGLRIASPPMPIRTPGCEDDSNYTVLVLGTLYDCAGIVGALGGLGVTDCNDSAEAAVAGNQAEAFTEAMEAVMIARCPASCNRCLDLPLPPSPSLPPPPIDPDCQDDAEYLVRILDTDANCAQVAATLAMWGMQALANCSLASETVDNLESGAFTADMEEDLLARCPRSCGLCAGMRRGERRLLDTDTCGAQCDLLPNNTCCDGGACKFSYNGVCAPQQTYHVPENTKVYLDEERALDVVKSWERYWLDEIEDFTAHFQHIEVSYFAARSLNDVLLQAARTQLHLLVIGYLLVIVYIVGFFAVDFSGGPLKPRFRLDRVPGPLTSIISVLLIGLSTFCTLGIAGFLSLAGVTLNPISLQILPFLSLGLGINNYFIFIHAVAETMHGEPLLSPEAVARKAMASAGLTITLSSFGNACAFFIAALAPVPAVRHFAIQMGLSVVVNYLAALLGQTALIFYELRRRHGSGSDGSLASSPDTSVTTQVDRTITASIIEALSASKPTRAASPRGRDAAPAPPSPVVPTRPMGFLARMLEVTFDDTGRSLVVRAGVLAVYVVIVAVSIYGATKLKLGLSLKEIVPRNTYAYTFADDNEAFHAESVMIVGRDLDYPTSMQAQFDLEYDFQNDGKFMNRDMTPTSPWSVFSHYAESLYCQNEMCSHEVQWVYSRQRAHINWCFRDGEQLTNAECRARCDGMCPQDPKNDSRRCVYSETACEEYSAMCTCPWMVLPSEEIFWEHFHIFLHSGVTGQFVENLVKISDTPSTGMLGNVSVDNRPLDASMTVVYTRGMETLENTLDHIRQARKITGDNALAGTSGTEVFPFSIQVYAFFEQYLGLVRYTLAVVGISLMAATGVMYILLLDGRMLLINLVVIAVIEVQLFGFLTFLDIKLNAITMVNLIMSVGFAIEFTAHISRAFMLSVGTRSERSSQAVFKMVQPVSNGALTTLLGLLGIGFSAYAIFVKYFFVMYIFFIVCCWLNGVIVLPIVLSFIGPSSSNPWQNPDEEQRDRNMIPLGVFTSKIEVDAF
ncbi:hypothetical protein CYMTET_49562 [Cymbomonas tetramitiformis]|uniref:SSD domain-containing protein n=1 Tax=Cymbomonas tetramitiformis TaxID=36881 RepID=A0AAE0EVP2_9CHLO|nr:hypothetical protein CYMTET_49562 [Cymbomonas tetramitiformis]